jgi:glutathione S-transferase
LKLYGFGATRSLRVLWALNELGVECEFVPVNLRHGEQLAPEFLRLNPAGKLPVLVDDAVVLTESTAIVMYLADKFPDKRLLPVDLAVRSQVYRWMMFVVTELESALWRMTRHTSLYPPEKRSATEIALAAEDFVAMAKVLDRHMIGRRYIVSEQFTAADCVTAYVMDWAVDKGLLGDLPQLRAYRTRLRARSAAAPDFAQARDQLESLRSSETNP